MSECFSSLGAYIYAEKSPGAKWGEGAAGSLQCSDRHVEQMLACLCCCHLGSGQHVL